MWSFPCALSCHLSLQTISCQIKNTKTQHNITKQTNKNPVGSVEMQIQFSAFLSSTSDFFLNGNIYIAVPPQGVPKGKEVGN